MAPRTPWIFLSLVCAAACGRAPAAAPDAPPPRRIALESPGRPPARAQTLALPAGLAPWSVEGAEARVVGGEPAAEPQSTLVIDAASADAGAGAAAAARRVLVPGRFDLASCVDVVVEASAEAPGWVSAALLREGVELARTGRRPMHGNWYREALRLEVLRQRALEQPADTLAIEFQGSEGGLALHALSAGPAAGSFPPAEAPGSIPRDGEARIGFALPAGARLSGALEVGPEELLEFSLAPHCAHVDAGGRPATLVVRVEARDGAALERRFPLRAEDGVPRWRTERVPLLELAGQRAELTFALEQGQAGCALALLGEPRVFRPHAAPPTVVLITSDTHRADHLGAARAGVEVQTPTLDALAARGVLFEDCLSTSNVTDPSHASMMTGVHVRDHGLRDNVARLGDAAVTLAESFRAAGWTTLAAVSTNFLHRANLGQGFDRWSWPVRSDLGSTRPGAETIDALEAWLDEVRDQPVFVWLHVYDAHAPYQPPDADLEAAAWPADRDPTDGGDDPIPESLTLWPAMEGVRDKEYPRAMYRGEIAYVDRQLARVLGLERVRRGIVAFTADHGESFGAHGVYYHHMDLYPDVLRVPLVLAWPDAPAGTRVGAPVQQHTVGRTLLELAGVDAPDFPAESLLPLAAAAAGDAGDAGADAPPPAPRFALHDRGLAASVTHDGMHLILYLRELGDPNMLSRRPAHAVRMYDLRDDPACVEDLARAPEHFERTRRLRAALVNWLVARRDLGWGAERETDAQALAELSDLGYTIDDAGDESLELFDPECGCERCAPFR